MEVVNVSISGCLLETQMRRCWSVGWVLAAQPLSRKSDGAIARVAVNLKAPFAPNFAYPVCVGGPQ
jgi:hypothetical protein